MENNIFKFSGRIASVKVSGNITVMHIATNVVSNSKQGIRGNTYFPCIVWYGEKANVAAQFNKSDRVDIIAKVRTSRKNVDGNNVYYQTIVGEEICATKSKVESAFGVKADASFVSLDTNEFVLRGTVKHIYAPDGRPGVTLFTIEIPESDKYSQYPSIVAFNKISDSIRNNVKEGDSVCIAGHVSTAKRTANDNPNKKYQSIICDEVSVV